jgi:hypothetical protein
MAKVAWVVVSAVGVSAAKAAEGLGVSSSRVLKIHSDALYIPEAGGCLIGKPTARP